jgi:hypothetical protein
VKSRAGKRGFNSETKMQEKKLGVRSEEEGVGRRVKSMAGKEDLIGRRECRIRRCEEKGVGRGHEE